MPELEEEPLLLDTAATGLPEEAPELPPEKRFIRSEANISELTTRAPAINAANMPLADERFFGSFTCQLRLLGGCWLGAGSCA
ncbi:hypothetical protein D3C75_783910 [compost metagenome]